MAEDASNSVAVAGSAATAASAGVAMSAATLFGVWIDRSEMVAVIGDLERDGLVARVRDEQDRRRNVVRLTLAGADTLKQLDAPVEEAQRAPSGAPFGRRAPRAAAPAYRRGRAPPLAAARRPAAQLTLNPLHRHVDAGDPTAPASA
jgi:hypothetical protein